VATPWLDSTKIEDLRDLISSGDRISQTASMVGGDGFGIGMCQTSEARAKTSMPRAPFRRDGQQAPYRERMAFNPTRMSRGVRRDNNSRFGFSSPRFTRDEPSRDGVVVEGRENQPPVEKTDSAQEKPTEPKQPKRFYTPKNTFALIQVCGALVGAQMLQEIVELGAVDDNIVLLPTLMDFTVDWGGVRQVMTDNLSGIDTS